MSPERRKWRLPPRLFYLGKVTAYCLARRTQVGNGRVRGGGVCAEPFGVREASAGSLGTTENMRAWRSESESER
jgi:hypothetical protein